MIVMDADDFFMEFSRRLFKRTLLIPVHAFEKDNHKAIRDEGFHCYLENVQNIKLADKGSIHQYLQGVFFALYDWNAGPVYGTDASRRILALGIELPFPIELSLARSTEGTSERQKYSDNLSLNPYLCLYNEIYSTYWYMRGGTYTGS